METDATECQLRMDAVGADYQDSIRERIVDAMDATLRSEHSPLLEDEPSADQLREQIRDILDDAIAMVDAERAGGKVAADQILKNGNAASISASIGRSRARQQIHPAESLAAAIRLFDLALPELTARLSVDPASVSAPFAVARALHHSIMARVTPASVGYVDVLLEKLSMAQREERVRVSRELHDRVAHGIAAGMQRINLSALAVGENPKGSAELLVTAIEILNSALDDTRQIALELRQDVGEKLLDDAVRDYLTDSTVRMPVSTVSTLGVPRGLSAGVGEEAFLVIREALRNAVAHSRATSIEVAFDWGESSLLVEVRDNGAGFDSANIKAGSMGLLTMRERAEVIGAELTVVASRGIGTTVAMKIELGNATL